MADDPAPFITVDLFAGHAGNSRGVLAGVHIDHVPAGISGRDVGEALAVLAATLAQQLDDTFRSITAETN